MKQLLSITLFFLFLSYSSIFAQSSKKNKMSKADKAYMMQNYYEAWKNYTKMITLKKKIELKKLN